MDQHFTVYDRFSINFSVVCRYVLRKEKLNVKYRLLGTTQGPFNMIFFFPSQKWSVEKHMNLCQRVEGKK